MEVPRLQHLSAPISAKNKPPAAAKLAPTSLVNRTIEII
jgi:hypothetical protein